MNKKILLPIIFGIIVTIVLLVMLSPITQKPIISSEKPINEKPSSQIPIREIPITNNTAIIKNNTTISGNIINGSQSLIPITPIEISYDSNSVLKSLLSKNDISMSNPLKISGGSITKYCTFYADKEKQNSIQYCTSTELKDSDGRFLGNIHMVGSVDSPDAVLGIIQTDPYMSNLDSIKTVFQIMTESLICNCWQDQKPSNIESVSAWIDVTKSYHLEAKKTTSHSEIQGLAQKQLILEVTTNTEGYIWKFIISN